MAATFSTGLPNATDLTLQCCGQCQQVNYPPRELCGHCLADSLWNPNTPITFPGPWAVLN